MDGVATLLVEDNDGDVRLIERAFEPRELPGTLHVVQIGDTVLDRLFQRGEFVAAPWIDLVLLDLNLPATNGQQILEDIESKPSLKRLPVIVLTSSQSTGDLVKAYEAGANVCLLKPVDPGEFTDLLQTFTEFWVDTAALPPTVNDDGE